MGELKQYERLGRLAVCRSVGYSWRKQDWQEPVRARDADEGKLGPVQKFRQPLSYNFDGTDTWFYPLFEKIEQWENECSDPGAIKLDLIITDAVLEHDTDISRSDAIQERRDGTLHTVMLNMLPEDDWQDNDLPLRCIQYPADGDNLTGMLRLLIAEFVNVYV